MTTRVLRFLRSPLFPIFMIVFVDMLGVGITLPVLPLYAQGVFHASAAQITLLTSVYFAAQFFAAPRLGRLSDRIGRRPVLIVSQSGSLAALLLSGAATGLPILYLARVVDGLTGGNISVAQAYLSDITEPRHRAQGLGLVNAAFGSGMIFGPAFGAIVAAIYGPRAPFFLAAVVSLVTITLSWRLLPESLPPAERARRAAAREAARAVRGPRWGLLALPGLLLLMAVGFLLQLSFFSFQTTWVLWAEAVLFAGRDPATTQQAVGAVFTFIGIFAIATQVWLVGPLVRRVGERGMVAAGTAMRLLPWVVMPLWPSLPLAVAVMPLVAIGGGVSFPALMALLTYIAPQEQHGQAIGLMESIQGVGRISGPLLAGWMFQAISPGAPMLFAAGISVVALLAIAAVKRSRQPAGVASR